MLPKLTIWGTGGHASVIAEIIRLQGEHNLVGFLDDLNPKRSGTQFCDAPILGGKEQLEGLHQEGVRHMILGFGDCEARLRLTDLVRENGFSLTTAVHPRAVVATGVDVGAGTVIAAGAVVNPETSIGENVIVNTGASVDHGCLIEDGVHICPGVTVAGSVVVGRAAWVGVGATVVDRVRIGAGSIIGAGAVVLDDIPDGVVAYGVPARVVRKR